MAGELEGLGRQLFTAHPSVSAPVSTSAECRVCGDDGRCVACDRGRAVIFAERAERIAAARRRTVATALAALDVGEEFADCTLDTYPDQTKRSLALVREFVETWTPRDGGGLALVGGYGTGKTGLMVGAVRALIERYAGRPFPIVWWDVPRLYQALRDGQHRPYGYGSYDWHVERCLMARVLVLDDLGAERPTDWTREQLAVIVNGRYSTRRPIFLTTNYGPDQLDHADFLGGRVVDRLAHLCRWVRVGGRNLRRGILLDGDVDEGE